MDGMLLKSYLTKKVILFTKRINAVCLRTSFGELEREKERMKSEKKEQRKDE